MRILNKQSDINSNRRHRPDYLIVLYMGLLMMLGLVVIYAIGPQRANVLNNAYGSNYSDTYFFIKQLISLAVALVAFGVCAVVPYRFFLKWSGWFLILSWVACAFLAVAGLAHLGIAQQTLGATRWFNLGIFGSFQPSEVLKFSALVFLATFLGTKVKDKKIDDYDETLIPVAIIAAISLLFIVVIQKDLGTGISMIGIFSAMLFVGGLKWKNIAKILALLLIVGSVFILSAQHRIDRVVTFLQGDSQSSTSDSSYHIEHAKLAIGTGGLFGVGIGNSVQATGYLPEAINDSVFAIMGETFGFVGLITILLLFFALLLQLLKIMDHLPDASLKLIIAGVFGWFGSHVILNVASMIGVAPLTGITLPLLSFGGTSMLFIAAALGLVFQISHYTAHSSNIKEADYESSSSRGRFGRPRYAGSSSIKRS